MSSDKRHLRGVPLDLEAERLAAGSPAGHPSWLRLTHSSTRLQANGGCCHGASATKDEPPPVKPPQLETAFSDALPSPQAPASGTGAAPGQNGIANSIGTDGASPEAVATVPAATLGPQQPAHPKPATAEPTVRPPADPADSGERIAPLQEEQRVRLARPSPSPTTADKVAGLPTRSGQQRAQDFAAESRPTAGAAGCDLRGVIDPLHGHELLSCIELAMRCGSPALQDEQPLGLRRIGSFGQHSNPRGLLV